MPQSSPANDLRTLLIPQQEITIHTHLDPVKVMHRIRRLADLPNPAFLNEPAHTDRPYRGDVSHSGFLLTEKRPWLTWFRRFALKLTGHIRPEGGLTTVEIRIEMEDIARYLAIAEYGLIGLFAVVVCLISLSTSAPNPDNPGGILATLALLAGFAAVIAIIINIQFSIAAARVRLDFAELLEDIDLG